MYILNFLRGAASRRLGFSIGVYTLQVKCTSLITLHRINQSLHDFEFGSALNQVILYCKESFYNLKGGINLYIVDDKVHFSRADFAFVKKFGVENASDMVLDYKSINAAPFIYDTYQLANCLNIEVENLFYIFKNCNREYQTETIKKNNGSDRIINIPSELLKNCQNKILHKILSFIPVSDYAKAYVKKRTLLDNASPHVGKRYILKLDITDFFDSICFSQVYNTAFNTEYYPKQIGVMLTTLCCFEEFLPQGAPTSPALSNIVMKNFDDNIGRWCKKQEIAYTRYCDDMTFSSNKPLYSVYKRAKSMLENMGFELNDKKTHFFTNANRQSVTGLTVNEKVSVSREYKQKLRQDVYYLLKFGFDKRICDKCEAELLIDLSNGKERYINNIIGKINYVLQIEPNNKWFRDALNKIIKE